MPAYTYISYSRTIQKSVKLKTLILIFMYSLLVNITLDLSNSRYSRFPSHFPKKKGLMQLSRIQEI